MVYFDFLAFLSFFFRQTQKKLTDMDEEPKQIPRCNGRGIDSRGNRGPTKGPAALFYSFLCLSRINILAHDPHGLINAELAAVD